MKTAIVHDYLNQGGGAERVVEELHRMFPDAPIFTSIVDRSTLWPDLRTADIRTSWMQRLPGLRRHFKKYVLCYPLAIESFRLEEYDLVISSSSAFAKGARTRPDALHVCYCYTPMRYLWDYERSMARERFGRVTRAALPLAIRWLRKWDLRTAGRPDAYVAISTVVAERIRRVYGREASVVFPPVVPPNTRPAEAPGDFFLVVCRLVRYKRIDLVVETLKALGRPLVVIGDGPDRATLEAMAGPETRFLGRAPDAIVADHLARCRALIMPGEEDFGLTPLEANAVGRPVIAFRAGGALDTVQDGVTGILFDEQTVESLAAAIRRVGEVAWDTARLQAHAGAFRPEVFREGLRAAIDAAWTAKRRRLGGHKFVIDRLLAQKAG